MSSDDQTSGIEETDKPKSTIIIPQKVMKNPLDVVNTYPSKFQNGTFKAHNPPPSDNEEESDNDDSDTHSMKKQSRSSHHHQSQSRQKGGKKSKYNHKKVEELKRQVGSAKAEVGVQKAKYEILVLKVNELITHSVRSHSICERDIESDENLAENLSVLQSTYLAQKEDYQQYLTPKPQESSSTTPAKSVQETIMQAEFLVEKTLEMYYNNLEKSEKNPALVQRYHLNEITLREKQLQTNQKRLDDELIKGFSQSSFSDVSESGATEEDKLLDNDELVEEIDFLRINLANVEKQLEAYKQKQAHADLYEARIQELSTIISSDPQLKSKVDQLEPAVLERHALNQRLARLEKRAKAFQAENNQLKTSLTIFHVETSKLEKQIEAERKSNILLNAFLSEGELASQLDDDDERAQLVQQLSQHIEQLKVQVSELQSENEGLLLKAANSASEQQFLKSGGTGSGSANSEGLEHMEDEFNQKEALLQEEWKIKLIQARSTVIDERQKIESEMSEILDNLKKAQEEKEQIKRKNDNLVSENSSYMAMYQTFEKQFKDALKENDKLHRKQAAYEDKEKKIQELEAQTEVLQEQLKEMDLLRQQNSAFQLELLSAKQSAAEIELQLADSKRVIEQQHKQVSIKRIDEPESSGETEDAKSLSSSEVEKFTAQIEELKRQNHEIELRKIGYFNENASYKQTYKKIEKQLRKSIKEREALKKELETEKQTALELVKGDQASVFENLRSAISQASDEREDLLKKVNKLEGKLKQMSQEAKMERMEKDFDSSVEERIENAKSQVLEEKQIIEAEKEEISKQLDETVKEKKLILVKSEAILNENQGFYQNINAIQKELKASIREKDALLQERIELKGELEAKEALVISLKEQIKNGGGSHTSQVDNEEKTELVEKLANLQSSLNAQIKESNRLKSELAAVEEAQKLRKLEDDFDGQAQLDRQARTSSQDELIQQVDQLSKQKSRVELEVSNAKDIYKSMEKEFRKSIKVNDEIRIKLQQAEAKVKELEDKLNEPAADQVQPAQQQSSSAVAESSAEIDDLKLENKALQIELNMLKKQNEDLEAELNNQSRDQSERQSSNETETYQMEDTENSTDLDKQRSFIELNSELAQKSAELEELSKQTTIRSNGLNSVIRSLDKELKRQVKENDESRKKILKIEHSLEKARSLISKYRQELNLPQTVDNSDADEEEEYSIRQKRSSSSSSSSNSASQAELKELKLKYSALEVEHQDLKKEYEIMLLDYRETTGLVEKTKTEIEQIEWEKSDLERKANQLSKETSNNSRFYNSLEKEFKKSVKEIDTLKRDNEALNKYKIYLMDLMKKAVPSNVQIDEEETEIEFLERVKPFDPLFASKATLEEQISKLEEQLQIAQNNATQSISEQQQTTPVQETPIAISQEDIKQKEALLREIEQLKEESKNYDAALLREKTQQETLIRSFKSTIATDRKQIDGLNAEVIDLKNKFNTAEAARVREVNNSTAKDEEIARLNNRETEKATRVSEKETRIKELLDEIAAMNAEVRRQQDSIEKYSKSQSDSNSKDAEIEDLKTEVEELQIENRILEQYREQAEMLKKKSDILEGTLLEITQKKDILAQKLRVKDEKSAQELLSLRSANSLLATQNEMLKQDRIGMIDELEGLIQSQDLEQHHPVIISQPSASQQSISKASGVHKPVPVSDFTEIREAKIKEKIQELQAVAAAAKAAVSAAAVVSDEYTQDNPEDQSIEQQQQHEDNDEFVDGDESDNNNNNTANTHSNQATSQKLAKLEEDFRSEVDSLKAIIKSKEQEISRLRVKGVSASSHVTPREKKSIKAALSNGIVASTGASGQQPSSLSASSQNPLRNSQGRTNTSGKQSVQQQPQHNNKKIVDRTRKSMPQILNSIGLDANTLMGAYQSENDFSSQITETPINNIGRAPTTTTAFDYNSTSTNGQLNSNNNNNSSQFLDSMYMKCIERSKNLLLKNESLLKSLKKDPIAASQILSNQAQIQANQNQINHALMSPTSPTPFQLPSQLQQLANLNSNPFASPQMNSSHNKTSSTHLLASDQFNQGKVSSSPNDHYFTNKTYSQHGSNTTPLQTSLIPTKKASTTTTSPVIGAIVTQATSSLAPLRLDYMRLMSGSSNETPVRATNNHSSQKKKTKHPSYSGGVNTYNPAIERSNSSSSLLNGPRYEGDRLHGLRHGKGCQYYQNGETYQGDWRSDKRHGFGILKDEFSIDIYNGEWEQDMYSGQGRLRNRFMQFASSAFDYRNFETLAKSWQFYSGEFKNNLMHGNGTLILANSEKFIGSFAEGKVHGQGSYYAANGEIITGVWNHSRLVTKPSTRFS